jgi:ABC-type phosphate transport system permease subunit
MFSALQNPPPFIVTIVQKPTHQVSIVDVLVGSLRMTGAAVLVAAVLGALLAVVLVGWHRRHPPERDRLPPVTPLVPSPNAPPSSQVR